MELYRGVIEDNNHPDENGQVKVRIFGVNTENNENSTDSFENISTEQLPWAEVVGGNELGLITGVGFSSILKQGTWVWVALAHGDPNKPVVLGVIKGTQTIKKNYSDGEGFCDPDAVFPFSARIGETDINEIARGVIDHTVIKLKNDNLDTFQYYTEVAQIPSTYPYNQVIETQSGHMIELDDTPDNERVQIIDKRGNYIEMKVDEYIEKAVKRKIDIIISNYYKHVKGGTKEQNDLDYFKTIAGYFKLQADGNLEIINDVKITGNLQTTEQITADGNITSKSEVADSQGNLSSLRDAYDDHHHIGNLGVPTSNPIITDPKTRASDFTWVNIPLGFDPE